MVATAPGNRYDFCLVKDYYAILGVQRDAGAAELRQAFRRLARLHHPDAAATAPAEARHEGADAGIDFREIREAYELLSDPLARRKYDSSLHQAGAGRVAGPEDSSSFNGQWRNFVPGFTKKPHRGSDTELRAYLTLEEVLSGCTRQVRLPYRAKDNGGEVRTITLAPGLRNGEQVRVKGAGKPGLNGGADGDLLLTIQYTRHARFEVKDANLLYTLQLDPVDAVLGGDISVPALQGTQVLQLPAGVQNGQQFRLHGQGLPLNASARADLIIKVAITIPRNLSAEELPLWKKIRRLRAENQE